MSSTEAHEDFQILIRPSRLEVNLEDLLAPDVVTIWLMWQGTSETYGKRSPDLLNPSELFLKVHLRVDEGELLEFRGDEHSFVGLLTCLTMSTSQFPTPKFNQWCLRPLSMPLGEKPLEELFSDIQMRAESLSITIEGGINLSPMSTSCSPFVVVQFGNVLHQTTTQKKTSHPEWKSTFLW